MKEGLEARSSLVRSATCFSASTLHTRTAAGHWHDRASPKAVRQLFLGTMQLLAINLTVST
jgi:hypothetical protein